MSFNAALVASRVLACLAVVAAVVLLVPSVTFGAALGRRTLVQGMRGQDVRVLQDFLTRAGFRTPVVGTFGPVTLRNVKRFQKRYRLTVDGIVDAEVVRKLRAVVARRTTGQQGQGSTAKLGDRELRRGARGRDVRTLQGYLTRVGFPTAVDGVFGAGTERVVRQFQRAQDLPATGVVDAATVAALRRLVEAASAGGASADLTVTAPIGRAKLLANGLAVPPADAPQVVKDVIEAGNEIATKPYIYGGGHGRWIDRGYDCSGSVSYALHGGGLLDSAMPSGSFMSWGQPGKGRWITIYANRSHMYMVVAGLRFDTSGAAPSRWQAKMRSSSGFVARHPAGL